jgi:hypothetical protein
MGQRANLKFCFKMGRTAIETFQLIKQAYGENAVSHTWVFEWYARFWDGRENLKDDKRSGLPATIRTPDVIETVWELSSSDHLMMEEELDISR